MPVTGEKLIKIKPKMDISPARVKANLTALFASFPLRLQPPPKLRKFDRQFRKSGEVTLVSPVRCPGWGLASANLAPSSLVSLLHGYHKDDIQDEEAGLQNLPTALGLQVLPSQGLGGDAGLSILGTLSNSYTPTPYQ